MERTLLCGIAFLLCTGLRPAFAQDDIRRPLPGYSRRLYGVASGLPEQTVQAITQTADRYLWIGTTGGLARFDGTHFTVFDRQNTPALRANSIFSLLAARDGSLWIGTEGSGLVHYQNGSFRTYDQQDGLTDLFVRTLAQDARGDIWIGTNNGVFRMATSGPERIERIDARGDFPPIAVNAICQDSRSRLWLGGSRLALVDGQTPRFYRLPGDPVRNRVKAIAETSPGIVWVGTVSGLYRLTPESDSFVRVPGIHGTVHGLHKTSDGQFWVSIVGQATMAYHLDRANQLTDPTIVPSDAVLSIFEDIEQNIWMGTGAGMLRFSRTPLTIVPLPHARESDFGTIYQDREGTLWMGSTQLSCLRKERLAPCPASGLDRAKVRDVLEDRDRTLWFGTNGMGLYHLAGATLTHYTTADGLANNFIRALLQDRDGTLWAGTDEGVSHFDGRQFTSFTMRDGLAYQSVRAMLQTADGDLWIGTELGLSHLRHNVFVQDAAVQALRQDKVWALHQDGDGSLWIGTRNNGLFRYQAGALTRYTTAEGLASDSIYDIEEDHAGRFWLSGPAGISMLNRRELDRFATDRSQQLSLSFYSAANDAETIQIFGGMQSAGAITPDGDVWFPSNRGPIRIAPGRIVAQPTSPVIVSRILADGREIAPHGQIDLAPGESRLEINYASVMLRPQEAIRFRYKLEGFDKNWNDAGKRHIADYTNVPPGHYVFRLAAYDLSHPDALSETSLTIVKGLHFYATGWFFALCVLAFAALVFALYRSRIGLLRRRFQAVLAERSRLAREVHDTLLQGCAGVSAMLEALSSLDEPDRSLQDALLDSARLQMRSTINEARDAIWGLRHEPETKQDFVELLRGTTSRLSLELGITITCAVEGQPFELSRELAHELMMVLREAIHNAAHHAEPALVKVQLTFARGSLSVDVSDDGCGFEPAAVSAEPMHFGIIGMKERILRLGGTFQLNSMNAVGTTISIRLPRAIHLLRTEPLGV